MTDRPPIPADGLAGEIAVEQGHLDRVYARLERVRAATRDVEVEGHARASIGNSGSLYERDVLVYAAARRRQALDSGYDGLVFGRLDLLDGEIRHIGRLGLRDEQYEPLLIDWRAPASAPFYRATAEEPLDVIRRRVIQSAGTTVTGLSDDLLDPAAAPEGMAVVGEGALMATLARARGTAMRDIVSTIQREQDEVIRAPADGATFIEGGPGTGKTAVALHRVAYLLYTDRNRYATGILIVGPSTTFVRYIDQVLPSLGEEGAALRSLGGVLPDVDAERRDPPALAAIKGGQQMRRILARAARDAPPGAPTRLRTTFAGEVITLDTAALDGVRRRVHRRGAAPNAARGQALTALIEAMWETSRNWADPPEHWEHDQFLAELRERRELREFLDVWWPVLTPAAVLRWFADDERADRYAGRDLDPAEVRRLAASYRLDGWSVADVPLLDELRGILGRPARKQTRKRKPESWEMQELELESVRRSSGRSRADSRGDDEDADVPAGTEDPEEYALIVVDEAQDLSPMQWRMLGRRGRYAAWTLVGDPAQSAWDDNPGQDGLFPVAGAPERSERLAAMDEAVGTRLRRTFTLTTNYRNSAEIFALAAEVLHRVDPDVVTPRAVRFTGADPVVDKTTAAELADAVRRATADLLAEVEGTVGVVTAAPDRDRVAEWLAGADGAGRLQVVDSMEAKGLEYDGVLVVEPAAIAAESGAGYRVLYVALTRATHRLTALTTATDWP